MANQTDGIMRAKTIIISNIRVHDPEMSSEP